MARSRAGLAGRPRSAKHVLTDYTFLSLESQRTGRRVICRLPDRARSASWSADVDHEEVRWRNVASKGPTCGRTASTAPRPSSQRWARMDVFGCVQGVCCAPNFDRPGIATEGQAFCILMDSAGRKLAGRDLTGGSRGRGGARSGSARPSPYGRDGRAIRSYLDPRACRLVRMAGSPLLVAGPCCSAGARR
jgi:hypothetical protein